MKKSIISKTHGIKIEHNSIIYLLNEDVKTAFIVGNSLINESIIIPRSIIHDSQEYIISRILSKSFCDSNVRSIQFSPDSELEAIENEAFIGSSIESISLPSSCIELEEGWCQITSNLTQISIDEKNPRYSVYDNQIIIGKSSKEKENFDVLVFCSHDISEITIPNFIVIIGAYSFNWCQKLQTVNITNDSKLRVIGKNAFSFSSIESISIPPSLTKICEFAFNCCEKLQSVEIPKNSQLQTIEKNAFNSTSIKDIFIPSGCVNLDEEWLKGTHHLEKVYVDANNPMFSVYEDTFILKKSSQDKQNLDQIVLCFHDIQKVTIPSFIEIIGPYSFCNCKNLTEINFTSDSNLRTIGKYAFMSCINVESLSIPSGLVEVNERWCGFMTKLKRISVAPNNKYFMCLNDQLLLRKSSLDSKNYNILVAAVCDIEKACIPSFIEIIESGAFESCTNLHKVEFPEDSKIQRIEKFAFGFSGIKNIRFPLHLTHLGSDSFSFCSNLNYVDFQENSEIQIIGDNAFNGSSIEKLFIPDKLQKICQRAFFACFQLRSVKFSENSEIQSIEEEAFASTLIKSFCIPRHVKSIGTGAFFKCFGLQIIEIDENSELQDFDHKLIIDNENTIIMIPHKLNGSFN